MRRFFLYTPMLLAATFYLEPRGWPAEAVFDHDAKVATLLDEGCPRNALPWERSMGFSLVPVRNGGDVIL